MKPISPIPVHVPAARVARAERIAAAKIKQPDAALAVMDQPIARILRPQAATQWLLPSLAAITPQYIEMVLRGALAGSHVQAWQLFDLMEDTWPRLRKNVLEVKRCVSNLSRVFTPFQEEDEAASKDATDRMKLVSSALRTMKPDPAADENGWDGTIFDLLDAWFKGTSVVEVLWEQRTVGKLGTIIAPRATAWVHPICYAWDETGRLGLRSDALGNPSPGNLTNTAANPTPQSVTPFSEHKFLIANCKSKSGSPLGGALLRPLAWWWCASNFSADWLLNFAQVFGLPFRWANYDPNAPQATIDAICAMLQNMGSAGWAAFPQGTSLDLKEASRSSQQSPQGDMVDRSDKQCDLLVLGQTLTTEMHKGGGSFAASKVHEGVKDEIITGAANFVADIFEQQLFPSILTLNFGDAGERPSLTLQSEKEQDLQSEATVISTLAAAGAGKIIGLDWLGKKFGIPKPSDGEETLGAVQKEQLPPGAQQNAALPDDITSRAVAVDYIRHHALLAEDAGHPFRGNQWTGGIDAVLEDEHWTGTPKEMHERADTIMRGFKSANHPMLGPVNFTKKGRSKTLFEKRTPHEFQSVKALPDLVKKSQWVKSEPDQYGRPEIKAMHTLEAGLKIGKSHYRVEMLVRESHQKESTMHNFYLHRLRDSKKGIASSPYIAHPTKSGGGTAGYDQPNSASQRVNTDLDQLTAIAEIEDDAEFETALRAFASHQPEEL